MTESKTSLTADKESETSTKVSSGKEATKKSDAKVSSVQKPTSTSPNKISKLALFACVIAIAAPSGHYYWQQLQHQQLSQTLSHKIDETNNATLSRYNGQIQQALTNQEQNLNEQLQQITAQLNKVNQKKIAELNATVQKLEHNIKQRQPSDWLLHEAEYLIRIAARTLWLEHDTNAAIGLLKDANARLSELNDPAFLPVRETIHQDINVLAQMPTLDTDEVLLTLMAINKQVPQLPLAIVNLGEEETEADINLSDDISDWQTNLAKTWQKFLNDFIRVRQRTGTVEALISPDQQDNLKQNLSLKIQLALWAATERKGELYQTALADIQQWLNEFFDMENSVNIHLAQTLTSLQKKQINYSYPSELNSLTAIRSTLKNKQNTPSTPVEMEPSEAESQSDVNQEEAPTNPSKNTAVQTENEGNI